MASNGHRPIDLEIATRSGENFVECGVCHARAIIEGGGDSGMLRVTGWLNIRLFKAGSFLSSWLCTECLSHAARLTDLFVRASQ